MLALGMKDAAAGEKVAAPASDALEQEDQFEG